jgi:hypothetical protein
MENRLCAEATAVIMVHPWGIDDGAGLKIPEPAGVAFLCTREKNLIALAHMQQVVAPIHSRLRGKVALIGYSLPGTEDPVRKMLYASIDTPVEALNIPKGQQQLRALLDRWSFTGEPLVTELTLDPNAPVSSYFAQTPSTHVCARYDRDFCKHLPMPLSTGIQHRPEDLVFYDDEGYPKVRDFLKGRGIRHVLLTGYNTDICVIKTTCGYLNLAGDFNVFVVGDATLATFPASVTPRFATQTALVYAALQQLITQVSWVRLEEAP